MEIVVVGDVHLVREGQHRASRALASVVRRHNGATVVLAGDALDLAAERGRPGHDAIEGIVGAHGELRAALGEHVTGGGRLVLVAGNHDAEVGSPEGHAAFVRALGLDPLDAARVSATPWFVRLGGVHIEHGHHYDPDNAMPHPLAPPEPAWAPLGVALMREFVVPLDLHALVHANGLPPLKALRRSWTLFGGRTPLIFARYLAASARLLRRAGRRYPAAAGQREGDRALAEFSERWTLSAPTLDALIAQGARPTLASAGATFQRLYLDRVLSLGLLTIGGVGALVGAPAQLAVAGGAALAASVALGGNRYQGRARALLRRGGLWLRESTGASTVIFGHTHEHEHEGDYLNTGSFAFPGRAPGHPYVLIDPAGRARHAFEPG